MEPRARGDVGRGGVFESARGGGNTDRGGRPGGGGSGDCHYCQGLGHWKNECPVLRTRGRGSASFRPTALAALGPICAKGRGSPGGWGGASSVVGEDYLPFITDGFVSLVG